MRRQTNRHTIHGHFINLRRIVLFDITKDFDVFVRYKVDGDTFASESTAPADTVDVQFTVVGKIVVDHQRHLSA